MPKTVHVRSHYRRVPGKRRKKRVYERMWSIPLAALILVSLVLFLFWQLMSAYPVIFTMVLIVVPVTAFALKKPKRMTKPLAVQRAVPKKEIVRDSRYISPEMRRYILQRDHHKCCYCGSVSLLEIDHCIPLSRGGATSINNLQVLCQSCNRKKGSTE